MNKKQLIEALAKQGIEVVGAEDVSNDILQSLHSALKKRDAEIATLKAAADKDAKMIEDLNSLNNSLNSALSSAEKSPAGSKHIVKLGKDSYELIVPESTLDGKPVNRNTLTDDSKLLQQLVDIGAGVIRKVKSSKKAKS